MEFRTEDDRDYANGAFIPGAEAFPPKWEKEAAAFRAARAQSAELDLRYGSGARQQLDLFLPDSSPKGALVFVHGGYWLAFGRETWSHLAAGAIARGWACAIPSYTLAPAARISDMTREISRAIGVVRQKVPGPIVVTGHSAGGHLAARMACSDMAADVRRVVPISPLADLRPLQSTSMNETLGIDETEARLESPALLAKAATIEAHVWVGAQERPAFLWQARVLSENWACPWTVVEGRHHFDVIDDLAKPESTLMSACLNGI